MSRRKQGKPQQRKTQDPLEQENDLLVCGDCQTSFPLHDIVQFIKHKNRCCSNKENLDEADHEACRGPDKPSRCRGNNNEIIDDINSSDDEQDVDDDDVDLERSSPRRDDDEDEEMSASNDNENKEDSVDNQQQNSIGSGDKAEERKKDGRKSRREAASSSISSSSRERRTPLGPRRVVDAESNTTHSEPSRFVCETCRSTYTSAWALLQHAQKEHGMKIYTSPITPNSHQSSAGTSKEQRTTSADSGGSMSPYPLHASNPFSSSPFRLPLDARASLSPFSRHPSFDFDLINDYRLRPQLLASGIEHASFAHGAFDHSRQRISPGLESHYDFYSKRLKQLANSPAVPRTKSLLPAASNKTQTSSKTEILPLKALLTSSAKESRPASTSSLPPKPKACEFCGKRFRFQSNLVVHRRSHTGEKPYKCPHCHHACTQQSKLKRHMKTHLNKTGEDTSPATTLNHKEDEGDDNDEGDDELDEECEEENDVDEEMNGEEGEDHTGMNNIEDVNEESGDTSHQAKRIKLEDDNTTREDAPAKSKRSGSLLSEVMKKTGLNDIQTFSEAYKAALAESEGEVRIKTEEGSVDGIWSHVAESESLNPEVKREPELDVDSDKEQSVQDDKNLFSSSSKRTSTPTLWPSSIESLASNNIDTAAASSVYSRLHHSWFQGEAPVRLFYSAFPSRLPSAHDLSLNPESHNGLSLSPSVASTSSALKADGLYKPSLTSQSNISAVHLHGTSSSGSSPTGSLVLSANGSGVTPPRKEHKRNDTCEFCGKVFKNCSNLTVHRRSHTGEKPYKCNLCSYACAQSSKLTRHMKTHGRQGKDVYTCKFCGMPFSVPSTLEKHMRKCVENRNARLLLAVDGGEHSSESNGEMVLQPDSPGAV